MLGLQRQAAMGDQNGLNDSQGVPRADRNRQPKGQSPHASPRSQTQRRRASIENEHAGDGGIKSPAAQETKSDRLLAEQFQLEEKHPVVARFWMYLEFPLLASLIWLCRSLIQRRLRVQLVAKGVPICIRCGYDLRGQHVPRCYECGTPFDETLLRASNETEDLFRESPIDW